MALSTKRLPAMEQGRIKIVLKEFQTNFEEKLRVLDLLHPSVRVKYSASTGRIFVDFTLKYAGFPSDNIQYCLREIHKIA
jgi:hypothetical protein